tara:strand:- start:6 stop:308 length:303 start_codon:yes stop_codon:yes gene_type:complete
MARRYNRKTRRSYKKRIQVPIVSTAGGLAVASAMGLPQALTDAMNGNVAGALTTVANAVGSQSGKQALIKATAGTVIAKLLLKSMPRSVGRLGPIQFTTN